jgi:hypothetical protein
LSAAGLLVLAGCGSGVPQGTGAAASLTLSAPPAGIPSGTPSPATGAPSSLAVLKPCELLSPAERSTAGLTSLGKDKTVGAARVCDWSETGAFGMSITLDDRSGLSGLTVGRKTATATKVGAHKAVQAADRAAADGTCAVLLGVGDSASVQVDVSNTNFSNTALACRRAGTVARLIEPKLP